MGNIKEMNKHELWTANEVIGFLRISQPTLYRWVRQGKIPYCRVGGTLRFRRDEIMAWMKEKV